MHVRVRPNWSRWSFKCFKKNLFCGHVISVLLFMVHCIMTFISIHICQAFYDPSCSVAKSHLQKKKKISFTENAVTPFTKKETKWVTRYLRNVSFISKARMLENISFHFSFHCHQSFLLLEWANKKSCHLLDQGVCIYIH